MCVLFLYLYLDIDDLGHFLLLLCLMMISSPYLTFHDDVVKMGQVQRMLVQAWEVTKLVWVVDLMVEVEVGKSMLCEVPHLGERIAETLQPAMLCY